MSCDGLAVGYGECGLVPRIIRLSVILQRIGCKIVRKLIAATTSIGPHGIIHVESYPISAGLAVYLGALDCFQLIGRDCHAMTNVIVRFVIGIVLLQEFERGDKRGAEGCGLQRDLTVRGNFYHVPVLLVYITVPGVEISDVAVDGLARGEFTRSLIPRVVGFGIVGMGIVIKIQTESVRAFTAYFFRYLSMICARGDNIAIICNSIHEAKTVYAFVDDGFSKISSLYSRRSQKEISFDDPIWKIHLIADRSDLAQRNKMQDASVIITTLPFICSKDFEYYSGSFIQLLHTVIFTCALETVNQYSDQLTAMNERFINIVENNARKSKSSESNPGFRIRYKSLPIRYIAFDDARIPGLDKALKNLLHINFESTDIMVSNSKAMVRLYNNEPVPNEKGIRVFPDILNTTERLGTVVNMAVIAAKAGAKQIFIYENGSVPFENYRESLNANIGRVKKMFGNVNIRINEYSYFKTDKAVVIVFDEKCNLPETIRKYLSLFGNTEILLMIFSKMYLYRDYYIDNISKVYQGCQYSRIPFYEGVFRDIARRILLKADSGGVTVSEIFGF